MTPEQLGELVKSKRDEKGWTLDDLAKKTALSRSTWSRVENGYPVTLATMKRIAAWLGRSIDELLA